MDTETLTHDEARSLAGEWHGGQTSALYSFSSTGAIHYPLETYRWELMESQRQVEASDDPEHVAGATTELSALYSYFIELDPNLFPKEDA